MPGMYESKDSTELRQVASVPVIDFNAARRRIQAQADAQKVDYVDVEFTPGELAPPVTIASMLLECVEHVGARGVRQELASK